MPEITVRKADGTLKHVTVDEEFVESMHDNYKCQLDCLGYNYNEQKGAKTKMGEIMIGFSPEDFDMILKYQDAICADTVQSAVLNAISLALDHADDGK